MIKTFSLLSKSASSTASGRPQVARRSSRETKVLLGSTSVLLLVLGGLTGVLVLVLGGSTDVLVGKFELVFGGLLGSGIETD